MRRVILCACAFSFALLVTLAATSFGQFSDIGSGKSFGLNGFGGPDEKEEEVVSVSAQFTLAQGSNPAKLWITAKLSPSWHIYSITQKDGGPIRTKIVLNKSDAYTVGNFTPTAPPLVHPEPAFGNLEVEEHSGEVTWWAPLTLKPGVDPKTLEISGHVYAQACAQSCLQPKNFPFVAKLNDKAPSAGETSIETQGGKLTGEFEPRHVVPGGKALLKLTFVPNDGWHVYMQGQKDPKGISKETIIAISEIQGLYFHEPVPSAPPTQHEGSLSFHKEPVTWNIEVDVAKDAPKGTFPISGIVGYQTCIDGVKCDLPRAARFVANVEIGNSSAAGSEPLAFTKSTYPEAERLLAYHSSTASKASLPWVIVFSLLGGAILNLMPCVLPVIGLKILSFVEQGGQHRNQILALNLWYSLGLISVFMVLASLAVFLNLGWGQQFSSTVFNIVMSGLVFVMALSFLGVWEIPIPGFVGTGKSTELASREGAAGAFAKGVLTTILATPCSGPFLGSVFGFTLKQPPYITYLIFGCIGLGMASPYLAIGAFPRLIRFLPRPGAWMDTFKQMMGFVLLGTVVFMFTFLNRDYVVPTFAMLIGLWFGCWWIGRTPITVEFGEKVRAWGVGIAAAGAVGAFAFTMLTPQVSLIAWKPFSQPTLTQLTEEGKTVLVDFTADWCLTCKANLKLAINTAEVRDAVEANGVVPLLADWTDGSAEIKSMLESLKSNSIPVLAIFPASRPTEPIILRDVVTKQQIVDAIKEAGPSRTANSQQATAMR